MTALIAGIIAFLLGWLPLLGLLAGGAAIMLALRASRAGASKSMWITGLVLGSLAGLTSLAMTVGLFNSFGNDASAPAGAPTAIDAPAAPVEAPVPAADEAATQAEAERVAAEEAERAADEAAAEEAAAAEQAAAEQAAAEQAAAEQAEADRVTAERAAAAQSEFGPQPDQQKAFIAHVATAQAGWDTVENDLQRGGLKAERDARLCETVPGLTVVGWTGVLRTIDANGDGKGVISVEIAENVEIKTWNNAFSDLMDDTLIDPSSPVFAAALEKAEGDVVTFNGEFVAGSEGECFRESSLTLGGAVQDPEFIFRFSYLS